MRVALRVEAGTARGLRRGIPNLMRLFSTYQVRASFFFPFGRDLSGRRPWQTWRARRRLGLAALTYGTLLPGPDLGGEAVRLSRLALENGHDVGLCGLSTLEWAYRMPHADADWVREQLAELLDVCRRADLSLPTALATPGWQTHPALLEELRPGRFRYTSMTRGKLPYLPVSQGVQSPVPEIPVTLPTVAELLRQPGVNRANVHEYLYAESRRILPAGHVFALSAEHEGLDGIELMEKLLVMWKGQDGAVRALDDVVREIDAATLPHHRIGWAAPDGGGFALATQGVQVPA
jgi:hypothetical protein